MRTHSFTRQVVDYLTARPNQFVSAVTLESVGGRQAWRTRVSEARIVLEQTRRGTIKNRLTHMRREDGTRWTKSEYVFIPVVDMATLKVDANGQAVFF